MARRNLLAMENFDAFKRWLKKNGVICRAGRGEYQVLQVQLRSGWSPIFRRNDAKEHYTVQDALVPLVREFIASRKNGGEKRAPVVNSIHESLPLSAYVRDRAYLSLAARRGLKFNGRFLY